MPIKPWLAERLPLAEIERAIEHKTVPQHRHSIWYYLGGMTLFLFGVQVVTGILLLLYYRPSAAEAYDSVQFIMTRVPFGWLVRSIHSWSANLLVGAAFIHLFSVLFLKAYRKPRELTWVSGALLLFVILGFGFTGYLLPWNELAFFATRVGTDVAGAVPVIGEASVRFLRGGPEVTGATLTRFYGIHVAVLPAISTVLLGLHLLLVQYHGMSVPPSVAAEAARAGRRIPVMPFVPHFALRDLFGWTVALAMLAALSAFRPWGLGMRADLFAPAPAGIQPEWYFLWTFQALKLMPAYVLGINGELIAITALTLGAFALVFLPFLDRNTARSRLFVTWGATFALVFMVAMTLVALLGGHG
ncbi:MAG TPA: cytochrome bc complex cytochrome b subunit [Vicinamibacterales bacterium]|nr:cytochrome bc complex cytochrome b subunit [Vicinamibacterales bacterium]